MLAESSFTDGHYFWHVYETSDDEQTNITGYRVTNLMKGESDNFLLNEWRDYLINQAIHLQTEIDATLVPDETQGDATEIIAAPVVTEPKKRRSTKQTETPTI